jgi:hypothetical protein
MDSPELMKLASGPMAWSLEAPPPLPVPKPQPPSAPKKAVAPGSIVVPQDGTQPSSAPLERTITPPDADNAERKSAPAPTGPASLLDPPPEIVRPEGKGKPEAAPARPGSKSGSP